MGQTPHSLDIGGQMFYHIHTSCDKRCVATLRYKCMLRVKSKDFEISHGDPTNTMYVTLRTVNLNTATISKHCYYLCLEIIKLINDGSLKLFTLNLTYNATPCHIVYDCGKKVGHLWSNNYHIVRCWGLWSY